MGVYPCVSIDQAREKREEARDLLKEGKDPAEEWKARRDGPSALKFEFTDTGALLIQTNAGHVLLSPVQTDALRAFLAAIPEHGDCPC